MVTQGKLTRTSVIIHRYRYRRKTMRIGIVLLCLGIICKIAWALPARMEAALCDELDLMSSVALLGVADDDEGLTIDD